VIAAVPGSGEWVAEYLGEVPGIDIRVHIVAPDAAGETTLAVLEHLSPIGEGTFVWAAGEASALVPVRRHLRRARGLAATQAQLSGYWRRGTVAFDHHAPIDPFDPDE
jgi:NADPH-dependent ferric siderophore reductase